MPKKKLLIFTQCVIYGGCDRLMQSIYNNSYITNQFDITYADGKIIYSVKQDNPSFINYEYSNEKGELGHYKNIEPQATLLVKFPVLKNAASIKVYQIDADGKQILISLFTFQNNLWK